ncbi:ATP-dependent DNA helicase [Neobacillus piezotolerans]|uniref:ATP-dependent DNA helicase n=1 Tax=Neobacillus piezotolerans TaxID=2259171 RepID=A0A3D8GNM7_9BACI|nr:helicase C-terminal domain-containing protein [Neobacillus piezotolerans]RDU35779.1 ATP-dependent DNA helicase [Neobacillus piezotolerans]
MAEFHVPARALAEYVYRSGSIESGVGAAAAMAEGTKAHQFVQKGYKEGDVKEVPLRISVNHEGIDFIIDGRCDGLLVEDGQLVIDEIKSNSLNLETIEHASYPVHWAQAKCYAYIVASEKGLSTIKVRLTYVNRDTYALKCFDQIFSSEELHNFFQNLIIDFAPYAKLRISLKERLDNSAQGLAFPFDVYRPGQKAVAGAVYRAINGEADLFINAPTGIGKTISTLYPAVKALGEGRISHVFYITARTTTRKAAEQALNLMSSKGLQLAAVTLTAKEKICFNDGQGCQMGNCSFASGYYDRINGAVLDILNNGTFMGREDIEKFALKHHVCPFEFSLDLAYLADVVICDYNYIYDPRVSLKRLFDDKKKRAALLIDEAHNLPDRAREMFSASLAKSLFLAVKRDFKILSPGLAKAASAVNQFFIDTRKRAAGESEFLLDGLPEGLVDTVRSFAGEAEKQLGSEPAPSDLLLDAYFNAQSFLRAEGMADERFAFYSKLRQGEFSINIHCLDPSVLLRKAGKGFRAKIFFSATLVPPDFFREMLGGEEGDSFLSVSSPFDASQTDVFIEPLSTRYRDRDRSYERIAETIRMLLAERPGNYFCFFPSYLFMERVAECLKPDDEVTFIIQQSNMGEGERNEFLSLFKEGSNRSLVGFAVLGGIFSEGIDLPGDKLNGVIIVGVGLPQLSFERDLLKRHFSSGGLDGYDYAYTYPGMVKVLQAGGRLIRSEADSGTILLIDDRFLQPKYLRLLPKEWKPFTVIN